MKLKGFNNQVSPNANQVASKFKYNGIELEEGLGVNLYEMDLRQYDPTIARWTEIDPVTHYSQSTYNAFDNNPIYWADPSGADSVRESKENKPEWDMTISSNAGGNNGGNDGGGTKPKVYKGPGVVGEGSGMVNQLPTVCIGCNDGSSYWSSEGEMYGYTADFESYKKEFGYSGSFDDVNSQWSKQHGKDYANQVVAWESRRKAASAMAHLNVWYTFFYQAEEVIYVMPGTAFGSLARGSTRAFGFRGILSKNTAMYRAVDDVELAIINSQKRFSLQSGGVESKYFAKSYQDAIWYGDRLYPNGYTILKAQYKGSVFKHWYPNVDIGAYNIPLKYLKNVKLK